MKRELINHFVLFFLAILISSCLTQKSTTYSNIPKPIKKSIERTFVTRNAFFYKVFEKPNSFLFWYYKQSTAHWFCYINGHLSDKGSFESNNGAHNLSIYGTNNLLKVELDKFKENCPAVLDGATFGYVINIGSEEHIGWGEEVIGVMPISVMGGDSIITNNFIEDDLNKIIQFNYIVKQ